MLIKKPFKVYDPVDKHFYKPSLTKQQFADECDINNIMAKWQVSGLVEHVNKYQGNYGDFSDVTDYQTSLNKVLETQDMFSSLPSKVRSTFDNDPSLFLNALDDPNQRDLLVDLGILKPTEEALASEKITEAEPQSDA